MAEESAAGLRGVVDWMVAARDHAEPLVRELLAIPEAGWDEWLDSHPGARTVPFFEAFVELAEGDPQRALSLTEFVVRHMDSAGVPANAAIALTYLRGNAWKARAFALLRAGRPAEALSAYEQAAAIYRSEPLMTPELEAVERATAPLREGVAARLLAETPLSAWPGLAGREELQNADALGELSRLAVGRVDSVPLESLGIAGLATSIADSLPREGREEAVAKLRAHAWKDLSVAYRYLARFSDSLSAVDVAEEILAPFDSLRHQSAILQLARAGTLDEAGRHDEAMALVNVCRPAFRQAGDIHRLFLCGILEGGILQHSGRHRDAVAVYDALLAEARGLNDPDIEGTLHNNAGYALVELGELAAAWEHLGRAAALFGRLGRPLQVARVQLARGRMLVRKGEVEAGLAQLHSARGQFLSRNLVEEAGLCGLDIVEAHLSRGALIEAEAFARQIVREFTAAHLSARAIMALGYLSDAIAAREASAGTVGRVQRYIRSLRTQPDADFAATA